MEYVSKATLEVNGQLVDDINSVTEKKVEVRKAIKLMNKTGVVKGTPQYGMQVEYVLPKDAPEFDWEEVENGTLTVDKENGVRVTFTGVYTLEVGDAKYDGEKETTRNIELVAMGRVKE
ncbi:MAG: phage protein [Nitrospirae bacterium]|nr:MAG: phage protein [Nitrospirota bacterium]